MNVAACSGDLAVMVFHCMSAFARAELSVVFDEQGISGRGRYIATRGQ